jgi:hypothetical protein
MSTRDLDPTVRLSVLDRLIDTEPAQSTEPMLTWSDSVVQLRAAGYEARGRGAWTGIDEAWCDHAAHEV